MFVVGLATAKNLVFLFFFFVLLVRLSLLGILAFCSRALVIPSEVVSWAHATGVVAGRWCRFGLLGGCRLCWMWSSLPVGLGGSRTPCVYGLAGRVDMLMLS
jgi:hypothetical protein